MAKGSIVRKKLPAHVREELEKQLVKHGFADYTELVEWLKKTHGYTISRAALHRFGQKLEERIKKISDITEIAKALGRASNDNEEELTIATSRLISAELFNNLIKNKELSTAELKEAAQSISVLLRSKVGLLDYQRKVQNNITSAQNQAEKLVSSAGLSPDKIKLLRGIIAGIT
ncbi:DUF3486 family protein [Candidatus Persebacteraceae bacterium Df01]|jgi:predicted transcriptional regulator|uniref:DUF3486 family protein n=1 Tax=Candidatus Doriopsillibacter californiensis TaxID=2970740 RepID=A0ABT7QMM4_9GAMM|nr:DUF3486 family protein [Candidatus Persebacteraceae bacterium Df01]